VVGYGFLVELLLFRHSVKGPSFSQEKYGPGSPAFAPVTASLLYLRQLLALLCCEGQRFGSAGHGEAFGRLERTVCRHTGLTRNIYQEALMLQADGWFLVATRGSHRQFKHPVKPGRVTVPGKPSDDVAPGTLNSIMKQSGSKQ
jgi:predicted RNA binding protein YcfA (HicA-like mRNA interferase family)